MRRLLTLALLPSLLPAADWVKFTSGPFEVFTDAGARAGRETLVALEEFRHAVGQVVGADDLTTPEPVRVLVFKKIADWKLDAPLVHGRNCYGITMAEKAGVPAGAYRALTTLLLEENTKRMPAAFERGLAEFFSTFEVNGIHITVGTPPGPGGAPPDLDWARVHMLVVENCRAAKYFATRASISARGFP